MVCIGGLEIAMMVHPIINQERVIKWGVDHRKSKKRPYRLRVSLVLEAAQIISQ